MSLSKLTEVALRVDSANRNVTDSDLIDANERFHPAPPTSAGVEDQWSYKEAMAAMLAAEVLTNNATYLTEQATTAVYRKYPETLSGNSWFGGQDIRAINYQTPDGQRTLSFYEVVGNVTQNRSEDARNLILDNKTWIASAPSVTDSTSPVSGYAKCTRDIEFFLQAIAYNLTAGGNNRVYDYALMSHEALSQQASQEGRSIGAIADDYELAINGSNDGTVTDEGVRDRLRKVIEGSADPDGNGSTLLDDSDITPAGDNCVDVVASGNTFLDLLLDIIRNGTDSIAHRSMPYGDEPVGMGRLHDAGKLITETDSATYDDGSGNTGIKGWIVTPPAIGNVAKFDSDKCPRDLGYFIEAIAHDLVRGGNYRVHSYAQQSRSALQTQASNDTRTYQEIIDDYELALNGSASAGEGMRARLQQVIQGTAIINGTPLDISNYDITPANDLCSDVVSAVNTFLDIILQILREGSQAVKQSPASSNGLDQLFSVPDNRSGGVYTKRPYSFNGKQVAKCLRDVEYYLRYLTYGLAANDFGIVDDLFLNGLVETNKAFGLKSDWYKQALSWMQTELTDNKAQYFGSSDVTVEMPSDPSVTFTITPDDQLNKAKEFIDYVYNRI